MDIEEIEGALAVKKWIGNHQAAAYFILVFAIAWAIWLPSTLIVELRDSPLEALQLFGGFAPWIAAMIVVRASDGPAGLKAWTRGSFRRPAKRTWYVTCAFLIPWAMGTLCFFVYRLVGGTAPFLLRMPDFIYPFAVLIAALLIGGNEEPGWRGFATPTLIKKYHPVIASCIVGFLWGIWHAPFYIPTQGSSIDQSFGWFVVMTTGLAVIWTWAYYRSGSVIPVMLLHGGFNQFFGYLHREPVVFHAMQIRSETTNAIGIWIFAVAVILLTKGRLGVTAVSDAEDLQPIRMPTRPVDKTKRRMRVRRWWCLALAVLAVVWVVDLIGGVVMERGVFRTTISKGDVPGIVHRPPAAHYGRGKMTKLPAYDPSKTREGWQIDLRSRDLSSLDVSGRENDLIHADFDSRTKWPASVKNMSSFKPDRFMELGKNPGFGLRQLHEMGITGKGVSVAIIDYPLLVDHAEVKGRVRMYEEIHCVDEAAAMHGCATSSIAVGRSVGVAPESDLYFIAMGNFHISPIATALRPLPLLGIAASMDYNPMAKAVDRIVEVNRGLPKDRKIRAISISVGMVPVRGFATYSRAIRRAEREGIFVITCSLNKALGGNMDYSGLGREPLSNPDDPSVYRPGVLWSEGFYTDGRSAERESLMVPVDMRCLASPTGANDYVFYRDGGASWAPPYITGLYALACQVKPDVTPQEFWSAAMDTSDKVRFERKGRKYTLSNVVNPVKLVARLKSGGK